MIIVLQAMVILFVEIARAFFCRALFCRPKRHLIHELGLIVKYRWIPKVRYECM